MNCVLVFFLLSISPILHLLIKTSYALVCWRLAGLLDKLFWRARITPLRHSFLTLAKVGIRSAAIISMRLVSMRDRRCC